jgi:hypothetical protein
MRQKLSGNKKTSALMILLSTLLLTSILLFVVVKGSSNPDSDDPWSADSVGDEADAFFDDSYVHEIYLYFENYEMSDSTTPVSSNKVVNISGLVINEFMADNDITIAGPDGNSPDWIELFNAGDDTIDLSGMYLTDDLTYPTCWQFPEDTSIEPGGYLLVWADRDGGELCASFALNANGEEIGLFASDGETLIDSVVFVKQIQDVSYGRIPDGSSTWDYLPTSTPGLANEDPSNGTETSVLSLLVISILFLVVSASVIFVGKVSERMRQQ